MQYMLMFYETADDFTAQTDARAPAHFGAWMAYVDAIKAAGIVRGGEGLQRPVTATSLRIRGEQRLLQDGPFAETKEQLGGFFIIEVPDLESALAWAARAPCAGTGGVEVRPTLVLPA